MRIALQQDIDNFMQTALFDKYIYPYLSATKYTSWKIDADSSDWNYIRLISESLSCYLKIQIDRQRDNEFSISLYSKSPFQSGKCIEVVKDLIRRYNPRALNSVVHSSNEKSMNFNKKLFGDPWGTEKGAAWNSFTGEYEDLIYFRKILHL